MNQDDMRHSMGQRQNACHKTTVTFSFIRTIPSAQELHLIC
jgi:hypothetical protein